jgi:hypothetical protein
MSIDSAKSFCERVQKDKEFADRVHRFCDKLKNDKEYVDRLNKSNEGVDPNLIHGYGYEFTPEELDRALKETLTTSAGDRELSKGELNAVAGGMGSIVPGGHSLIVQSAIQSLRSTSYK